MTPTSNIPSHRSPPLNEELRTPMGALRDLLDKAEKLARHIKEGAPDLSVSGHMHDFIDKLPFDELTEAEGALKSRQEERETEDYYRDQRAMYREVV